MPVLLSAVEHVIYEQLLEGPPRSVAELVTATGRARRGVTTALSALESRALVVRLPGDPVRYDVRHPQEGFATLMALQQDQMRIATAEVDTYVQRYTSSRRSTMTLDVVEVLTDEAEAMRRYDTMQRRAEHDIRGLDRPPYVSDPDEVDGLEPRRAGVRYRVISDTRSRAFRHPGVWEQWEAAGQETREMVDVPLKMVIADGREALIVLDSQDGRVRSTLVVHESSLLSGLVAVFESLWKAAAPRIPSANPTHDQREELAPDEQVLLSLLASGVTDAVIASRLGLSPRTLQRRIHELMEHIGASNRLQIGMLATRRGWL